MSDAQTTDGDTITISTSGGEATLIVSTVSTYDWVWSDAGSGARKDCTVWRPTLPDDAFHIVGDHAQGSYSKAHATTVIVKAVNDDDDDPLIKSPEGYAQVWNDKGSRGDHNGAIWFPVAPPNYVAIGFVASKHYAAPAPRYACIRRDLVEETTVGDAVWSDAGSGAHEDVTLYSVNGSPGLFVAQGNYHSWSGTVYRLKQP